jgi:hypothetical protein
MTNPKRPGNIRQGLPSFPPSQRLSLLIPIERGCPPCVFPWQNRPPNPRPKPTGRAVTRGNIAELAATAFVALLVDLPVGYKGEQCSGGEGGIRTHGKEFRLCCDRLALSKMSSHANSVAIPKNRP